MKHRSLQTTPAISKRMANVHLKGGKAETLLAKNLWHLGYRYRLNYRKLPGSPDIAITKHKVAVFVDGEFWHGFDWENRKSKLRSNKDYWIEKIEENIARDKRNNDALSAMGWQVIRFWEKDVLKDTESCIQKILSALNTTNQLEI